MTTGVPERSAAAPGAGAKAGSPQESRLLSGGVGAEPPPRLESIVHNSANGVKESEADPKFLCPNKTAWLQGVCRLHRQVRYRHLPCNRRDCPGCGALGRWRHKERIEYGIREIGIENCAFIVLTYGHTAAEDPRWKPKASRELSELIRWFRTKWKMVGLEYVATYELTKRGRLHINLILGNWKYIPKGLIRQRWGGFVHVGRVMEVKGEIAVEITKSGRKSVDALSTYITKLDQVVPEEWGKRVTYSQRTKDKEGNVIRPGWPKLPVEGPARVGAIDWLPAQDRDLARLEYEQGLGIAREATPGEWSLEPVDLCDCFEIETKRLRDALKSYLAY